MIKAISKLGLVFFYGTHSTFKERPIHIIAEIDSLPRLHIKLQQIVVFLWNGNNVHKFETRSDILMKPFTAITLSGYVIEYDIKSFTILSRRKRDNVLLTRLKMTLLYSISKNWRCLQ
jgi:hypothetical protein